MTEDDKAKLKAGITIKIMYCVMLVICSTIVFFTYIATICLIPIYRLGVACSSEGGESLELDDDTKTTLKIFKLCETFGEAIPQIAIAITFYVRHNDYILQTDFQFVVFGVTITQTAVTIFFSCVSILIGIVTSIKYIKPFLADFKKSFDSENDTTFDE